VVSHTPPLRTRPDILVQWYNSSDQLIGVSDVVEILDAPHCYPLTAPSGTAYADVADETTGPDDTFGDNNCTGTVLDADVAGQISGTFAVPPDPSVDGS
jgi:hypothetical protein